MILLDKEQMEAVNSNERNIVVIAAAGSGKTRTLTERVKRLLNDGAEPSKIVCITFTNLAAEEMVKRLEGVVGADKVFIGTIHSYASFIYGGSFTLRTTELEVQLIKELLTPNIFVPSNQALSAARYNEYQDYLETCASANKKVGRFLTPLEEEALEELLERLDDICANRTILSFDELIERATTSGNTIEIEHLLVDEFQDVGRNEYRFVRSLAANNNFFVGDDWQSIYSFRGANVKIFTGLLEDENFKVLYLLNNYRSGRSIIYASNNLISLADEYIHKEVRVVREDSGEVRALNIELAAFVNTYIKRGNYKDWFILVRTNKDIAMIMGLLKRLDIPAVGFKREGLTSTDLSSLLESNKVKVLTVHVSKGLESPNVLYYNSMSNFKRTEESFRIDYVAMTRAMDRLFMISGGTKW